MSDPREWLIRKSGLYYRPNRAGYTDSKAAAGRYTKAQADWEASVEPWHMSAIHQDDVPDDAATPPLPSRAARDVLAERARQIDEEDWTPEHDDGWPADTLALAASCYALPVASRRSRHSSGVPLFTVLWPWDHEFWKSTDRRGELVKAGALILAEIERLDRAAAKRGRVR